MGKVFEMPAPCVVLVQITGGIHRKLSVLWNHFDLSQSRELDSLLEKHKSLFMTSLWSEGAQGSFSENRDSSHNQSEDSTEKTQLLLGIEKIVFIVLIYTVNMHLITTFFNILHNWE